jgi:hypothetical protein
MALTAGLCFGQQRLAVPPFQDRNSGIDTTQIEMPADLFVNVIQRTNRFGLSDRDALALLIDGTLKISGLDTHVNYNSDSCRNSADIDNASARCIYKV